MSLAIASQPLTVPPLEMPHLRLGHKALRGRHRRGTHDTERPEDRREPFGRHRRGMRHDVRGAAAHARLEHLAPEAHGDAPGGIGTGTAPAYVSAASGSAALCNPPQPPIRLTPALACDPNTDPELLWHIARSAPELRRWLVANPRSDATLLEYVAQAGGPGVHETIAVLLDLLERQQRPRARRRG